MDRHADLNPEAPSPPPGEDIMRHLLDVVVADHMDANRRLALRAKHIVEVIDAATRHPYVYTSIEGPIAAEFAERAAILDIALRLQLAETTVRDLARLVHDASTLLPSLWRRAEEGFVALGLVESAVAGAGRLIATPDATDEERKAADAALRELDSRTHDWAVTVTPAGFRSRLARLLEKLDRRKADARHVGAMRDRKVIVEHVGDGMAWVSALLPSIEAAAIKGRLTATAKHIAKDATEARSRDQIRADLLSTWLRGVGTPTAVKTKVFVTIPAALLMQAPGSEPIDPAGATIIGHGPLSPIAAKQIFLEAESFRRVITDPVSSVVLDMDRRTYRPTKAQRDWLVLQHGTCARDGCTRLAAEADIDHVIPWARGGKTDIRMLRPLCPTDHAHRHRTNIVYRSRENGSVEVTTPTGFTTTEPAPF